MLRILLFYCSFSFPLRFDETKYLRRLILATSTPFGLVVNQLTILFFLDVVVAQKNDSLLLLDFRAFWLWIHHLNQYLMKNCRSSMKVLCIRLERSGSKLHSIFSSLSSTAHIVLCSNIFTVVTSKVCPGRLKQI